MELTTAIFQMIAAGGTVGAAIAAWLAVRHARSSSMAVRETVLLHP